MEERDLRFELGYYDSTIQRFNYYTTRTIVCDLKVAQMDVQRF